ncbi:BTE_HP_G0020420.mRNA.1.CDS.1 [Saccharomyces cerevisiae]|nr:BTE_HP_G0020420.mRNA.1.CDS.1 [Saccharomyces cerevisiae]CAI6602129.1 BTE_HP_G0020420.mRNA.1.CDS.1 [Saccharomyces cerevisiae]
MSSIFHISKDPLSLTFTTVALPLTIASIIYISRKYHFGTLVNIIWLQIFDLTYHFVDWDFATMHENLSALSSNSTSLDSRFIS